MVDDKKLETLERAMKHVFAMPITRSTFRQVQNAVLTILDGNAESTRLILESFLVGEPREGLFKGKPSEALKRLIAEFSIQTSVSKNVFERGEFLSVITSDMITQGNRIIFSNRITRVDGEEHHVITDVESTIQLLQHFSNRILELGRSEGGKDVARGFQTQINEVIEKLSSAIPKKK